MPLANNAPAAVALLNALIVLSASSANNFTPSLAAAVTADVKNSIAVEATASLPPHLAVLPPAASIAVPSVLPVSATPVITL